MAEYFNDHIIEFFKSNSRFNDEVKDIMELGHQSELSFTVEEVLSESDNNNMIYVRVSIIGDRISYIFEVRINFTDQSYQIVSSEDTTEQEIKNSKLSYDIDYWSYNITYQQLAQMYEDQIIRVPEMQRGFVWNHIQASRLIESIIMGLPLPSIFLVAIEDNGKKRYLVIDGLQRITTIHAYIYNKKLPIQNNNVDGFYLKGVNSKYENKNYYDLGIEGLADNLKYNTINVIEFKQNLPYNESAMYSIFERLNSGGTTLSSQQIRNSIFYGYFNQSLNKFSQKFISKYYSNSAILNLSNSEVVLRAIAVYHLVSQSNNIEEFSTSGTIVYKSELNKLAEEYHIEYKKSERKNSLNNHYAEIDSLFHKMEIGVGEIERLLGDNAFKKYDVKSEKYTSRIVPIIFEAMIVSFLLGNPQRSIQAIDFETRYRNLFISGKFDNYFTQGTGKRENIKKRIITMDKVLFGD